MGDYIYAGICLIGGFLVGATGSRTVNGPTLQTAIIACQPNQGIQSIVTGALSNVITAKCLNGASFEIENETKKVKDKK